MRGAWGTAIEHYVARVALPATMAFGPYTVEVSRDGTSWVAVPDHHLEVLTDPQPLTEFDVSDPANPTSVGYLSSFGTSANLSHVGSLIYLTDQGDGVYVIHEDLPTGVVEYNEGTPNLCTVNVATPQKGVIRLSVAVSHIQDISVTVYDATGRAYTSLDRDQLPAGEHEFMFSPAAAGVYFVQVNTGDQSVAKKVVFVR